MTSAKGVHSRAAQVLQGCHAVTNRGTEESGLSMPPRPEADAQTKAKGGEHVAWLLSEAQLLSCSWVGHHFQHYNERPPVMVNLECQQNAIWGHHGDISGMSEGLSRLD